MINTIWLVMIIGGVVATAWRSGGDVSSVTTAVVEGSDSAVELVIGLVGILAFWSGIMRLAQEAGLTQKLGRLLGPVVRWIIPSVPPDHPAMGAMLLAFSANILGLGNAATPLGIKAMEELQELNSSKGEASDAMCTFTVICTSGLTLIPGTVIALRAAAGSSDPSVIVGGTIFATTCSTVTALTVDRLLRRRHHPNPPARHTVARLKSGPKVARRIDRTIR